MLYLTVLLVDPNCSFPYTYNGGLYYSCTENMTDVSTSEQPLACLNVIAIPIVCDSPGQSQFKLLIHHSCKVSNCMVPTYLCEKLLACIISIFVWLEHSPINDNLYCTGIQLQTLSGMAVISTSIYSFTVSK